MKTYCVAYCDEGDAKIVQELIDAANVLAAVLKHSKISAYQDMVDEIKQNSYAENTDELELFMWDNFSISIAVTLVESCL